MEQVQQLKDMREAAQKRLHVAREDIKRQLLALENSADAKLVKSLGVLISDLELLTQNATTPAVNAPVQETPKAKVENVAENALANALGTPAPAAQPKAESLSELADQLRGTMASS